MGSLEERAERFLALHRPGQPLLLPNPWDAGTARLLEQLGFQALGTTSLGVANAGGVLRATRQDVLANTRAIAEATALPVSADLENGFARAPLEAARMVAEAARCGAVGASIEDASAIPEAPIYDLSLAVERVAAAAEQARAVPHRFTLTARAENFLHGVRDLDDTIRRLQAFQEAGADVLYAPGLRSLDQMRAVVENVERPVNVVMGFADPAITLDDLAAIGVARVSIGGALSRHALAAFCRAAAAMREGRFEFVGELPALHELRSAFREPTPAIPL